MSNHVNDEQKQVVKQWWFWTIIGLIILVTILVLIIFANKLKARQQQDNTNLTTFEVMEYLQSNGYKFEVEDYTYIYTTHYVILRNDADGIWIQKIINDLTGTYLTFKNDLINDEHANITSEAANETEDKKQQYKAFLNWLEDMGLTKRQLNDVLDLYDEIN